MFFKDFTPLFGTANQVRAGRIYPGGNNLNRIIGKKTNPEKGWYYPEAWIFSPSPAINPGSERKNEGQTIIYDKEKREYTWQEYIKKNKEVLGTKTLGIKVKLLDGDCTLPKEFHFREKDENLLREYPLLKRYNKTIIKPEIWIRHPTAGDSATESFIGFNRQLDKHTFLDMVHREDSSIENVMNKTVIDSGEALYIEGGIVHSLGKGLYFEVLSDGDLKITLQSQFAGRNLSLEERLDKLFTGSKDDLLNALGFVDYSRYGTKIIKELKVKPQEGVTQKIIQNPYFTANWLRILPGEIREMTNEGPNILVVANGEGYLETKNSKIKLQKELTDFDTFCRTGSCYAGIIHDSVKKYSLQNLSQEELIILQAN